jgi:hypothetical protein
MKCIFVCKNKSFSQSSLEIKKGLSTFNSFKEKRSGDTGLDDWKGSRLVNHPIQWYETWNSNHGVYDVSKQSGWKLDSSPFHPPLAMDLALLE